ncbi:MAG: MazG nucleotide pyrophosphohydrolase domain-containing protein [bacterium]|nr:MazG nucleotide pyrophosphohydrolase domain-containing protein [bacterium]
MGKQKKAQQKAEKKRKTQEEAEKKIEVHKMEFQHIIKRALEIRKKYSDLEKKKYGKEWDNEQVMKGFEKDIKDLKRLVTAEEKKKARVRDVMEVDSNLSHELADCLWSILILADRYGINMEKSFFGAMEEIEKKIDRKSK